MLDIVRKCHTTFGASRAPAHHIKGMTVPKLPTRKLNPRQERFAQAVAAGKTLTKAYTDAGYKPDRRHASRLAAKGDVKARVQELLALNNTEELASRKYIVAQCEANWEKAYGLNQIAAANRAVELKGKTTGLFHERVHVEHIHRVTTVELIRVVAGADEQKAAALQQILDVPEGF